MNPDLPGSVGWIIMALFLVLPVLDWYAAVEAAKERIRAHKGRPWYIRLFPYRIRIERL